MNKKRKITYTKKYLITLASFVLMFFVLAMSPYLVGKSYKYENSKMKEYEMINDSSAISLVKKAYNPENKIMRLDFKLKKTKPDASLSNILLVGEGKYAVNLKKIIPAKVVKVNEDYYVIYLKNIPNDYGVFAITLSSSEKINVEDISEDAILSNEKSLKYYIKSSNKINDATLRVENKNELYLSYIENSKEEVLKEIEENEKIISHNKENISLNKFDIDSIKTDLEYQTESEKVESMNSISTKENKITTLRQKIKELETLNKELKTKINLLERKENL